MTSSSRRAMFSMASIYALRMLGLFLILPVFAVYAQHLPGGGDHTMVGLAMGAYGLTQACLQLPFGIWSDRFGRKKVIYAGLLMLAAGSLVAALSGTLHGIIIGRALQGAGAISAAVMALLADLTDEEQRTHAFAIVGSTIGLTFAFSLVAGPWLYHSIGVPGMFALTAVLALAGILVVAFATPNPPVSRFHSDAQVSRAQLRSVLRHPELLRLDFGIFSLHAAQMAMFVVIPFTIIHAFGWDVSRHWLIYLPVMVVSFCLMVPFIIVGEKKNRMKPVFVGAVALLLFAQGEYALTQTSRFGIVFYLLMFYLAFNVLEASLPSLISKIAPVSAKGTAIGVYNTSQSLGIFVGSVAGGVLSQHVGSHAVFAFSGALILVWLLLALSMKVPPAARTRMFPLSGVSEARARAINEALAAVPGVFEAVVLANEQVAYLKVSRSDFDEESARRIIAGN